MAAVAGEAEALFFEGMSELELRQWVEANPGRINDRARGFFMPLLAVVLRPGGLSLLVWLLDEKGADVNATTADGKTALHHALSLDILNALIDRDADPTIVDRGRELPLFWHVSCSSIDTVARLLQDPRVRATVNAQRRDGYTALHYACFNREGETAALRVDLFLQVGANPTLTNKSGQAPLDAVLLYRSNHHAAIALLKHALAEPEKASLLVKARRLAVAANSNVVAPSCLEARVARGQPLPRVVLVPLTDGQNEGGAEEEKEHDEDRKLRTALAFMCGVGREGMLRDVFRVVMDLVIPSWDPLRRKNIGAVPQMPAQG